MWVQGIFRSVNTIRYEKYIYFKVSCLCLVLLSELAMAQEWVTWAQEKYLTGYFVSDKFNNKTFEPSAVPREFVRKNLSVREEEKIKLMTELFGSTSNNLAILAIDRGQIVLERYKSGLGPQTKFFSYSMSKSLSAYTLGMDFCEKGISDFRQPAQNISSQLNRTAFGKAAIEDLFTMSSGAHNWSLDSRSGTINNEWNDLFESNVKNIPDILSAFDVNLKNPGVFVYKNSDTNSLPFLLGAPEVFLKAFDKHFVQPAGLTEKSHWLRDRKGHVSAAGGYSATLKDWGRIVYHTQRILSGELGECSKKFMNTATSAQIKNAAYGYDYGYQTWIHQRGPVFIWMGVYGQRAFIDKTNQKAIIIFRSSEDDDFTTQVTRTFWAP